MAVSGWAAMTAEKKSRVARVAATQVVAASAAAAREVAVREAAE